MIPKLLGPMVVAFALIGCSESCDNEIIRSADAPDGSERAVVFQRACGATTGFSTQVSVLRRGDDLAGPGNVLIADGNHGAARVRADRTIAADVRWLSPTELLVTHDGQARVFLAEDHVRQVRVRHIKSAPR